MTTRLIVVAALAALAGCKKKTDDAPPPTGSGTATAGSAGSGSATPAPGSGSAAVAPASDTVKLFAAAGFGCIGWSAKEKAPACVTGATAMGEDPRYQLELVGGREPVMKLAATSAGGDDTFDAATVTAANATLAKLGVQSFDGALEIKPGGKVALGNGATLAWTATLQSTGGDNTAPLTEHAIVATCANKQTAEILKIADEGTDPELELWTVPDHVVIDLVIKIAREGEYRQSSTPMVLELATCTLTRSAG